VSTGGTGPESNGEAPIGGGSNGEAPTGGGSNGEAATGGGSKAGVSVESGIGETGAGAPPSSATTKPSSAKGLKSSPPKGLKSSELIVIRLPYRPKNKKKQAFLLFLSI
jgi:hypothetical protein